MSKQTQNAEEWGYTWTAPPPPHHHHYHHLHHCHQHHRHLVDHGRAVERADKREPVARGVAEGADEAGRVDDGAVGRSKECARGSQRQDHLPGAAGLGCGRWGLRGFMGGLGDLKGRRGILGHCDFGFHDRMVVRMYDFVAAWLYGCMVSWLLGWIVVYGCLATWLYGCMFAWLLGFMMVWFVVAWLYGRMVSWLLGCMVLWFSNILVAWLLDMVVSLFSNLVVWWFGGLVVSWCRVQCCGRNR